MWGLGGETPETDDIFVTETLSFDALVLVFSQNNYISLSIHNAPF